MKKRISCVLAVALSVSMLAGCGSKSPSGKKVELSLAEVVENTAKSVENIDNFGVDVSGEARVTGSSMGMKMAVSGSVDGSMAVAVTEEPAFSMEGKASYKLSGGGQDMSGKYNVGAYGATEDGELTVYVKNDKDWFTDSVDISDAISKITDMKDEIADIQDVFSELDEDDLKEMEDVFKLENKTKFVGKKECYVISANLDTEDLETLEKFDIDTEDLEGIDNLKAKFSIYLEKNTFFPKKFEINVTGSGEEDGATYKVEKCNFSVTFNVNDAKVKSVPKEAISKAESTDLGLEDALDEIIGGTSNYYDDDDDDYYYNDDDENYDDDDDDNNTSSNEGTDLFPTTGNFKSETTKMPTSVKFEGKEVKKGSVLKDFITSDYTLDESYGTNVPADDTEMLCFDNVKGGYIWVYVYNDTDKEVSWEDAKLRGFDYDNVDGALELDNGVKLGGSVDDLKKAYADVKPYSTFASDYCPEVKFADKDSNTIEFTYDPSTNKVTAIDFKFAD